MKFVDELTEYELNLAVAMALGYDGVRQVTGINEPYDYLWKTNNGGEYHLDGFWVPATSWSQAGPIIEKHKITFWWSGVSNEFMASMYGYDVKSHGETPLIASMRCFAIHKLGMLVQIPDNFFETE